MKKLLVFFTGMMLFLFLQQVQAQPSPSKCNWIENFDGNFPPSSTPIVVSGTCNSSSAWSSSSGDWGTNTFYYLSSPIPSSGNPKSCRGKVPSAMNDSTVLTTGVFDCATFQYPYVYLRFNHICKISPRYKTKIEYRIGGQGPWRTLLNSNYANKYLGTSANYSSITGFSAASYPEWRADDSTVMPQTAWWKEELFDLSQGVSYENVEFRFIIYHGNASGTDISYGWLLENVEVIGAQYDIHPPTVRLMAPLISDTVYSVGPWEINALVKTNTTAPIQTPVLKWTVNGVTDSMLMTGGKGDLWKASIPQYPVGSTVYYTVVGRDGFGNESFANSFYQIKIPPGGGYYVLQDGGTSSNYYPFNTASGYSRSMALYTVGEIDPLAVGMISSVSLRVATAATGAFPIKIWMKTVPASKTAWSTTTDNLDWSVLTQDAALVYDGDFKFSPTGWVDIPLDKSFPYSRQGNLVVMFEQNCGGTSCSAFTGTTYFWYKTLTSTRFWQKTSNSAPPTTSTSLSCRTDRPDLRINVIGQTYGGNSVAVTRIIDPGLLPVQGGQLTPVNITIRNRGTNNLDSCDIYWKLNGSPASTNPYPWKGSLSWDFEANPLVGNYTPRMGGYDTLVAWVSMPNGVQDSIKKDDTLTKIIFGCPGPMQGDYTIGTGQTFASLKDAIKALSACGVGGNVRFLYANGTYTQPLDFTNLGSVMNGYKLTITSISGNRNNVIINPPAGAVVATFGNNCRNIVLDALTLGRATSSNCVEIVSPCTNITIRNCNLLCDTNTSSSYNPLYKSSSTGIVDSFFLINCLLEGGYYGCYFYGQSTTANSPTNPSVGYNTNVVFDSNTFRNAYYYGLYGYYTDFISLSYNKIISRVTGTISSYWYGMCINYCNAEEKIVGNSILQRSTAITYSYGIQLSYSNYYCVPAQYQGKPLLLANNEISLYCTATGSTSYYYMGIYFNYVGANVGNKRTYVLNNSIYIGGSSETSGMWFSATTGTFYVVKNNMIHLASSAAAANPIYLSTAFSTTYYDIDSNNLYSPVNVGYAGANRTTVAAWQSIVTTDKKSQNINPTSLYKDAGTNFKANLNMNSFNALWMGLMNAQVKDDITRKLRGGYTSWGCYANDAPYDCGVSNISGLVGSVVGQPGTLTVDLTNMGSLPADTVDFCWKVNGVSYPPARWVGTPIAPGDKQTVTVGVFNNLVVGTNTAEVIVCGLGSKTDGNKTNDTARTTARVCVGAAAGTVNIPGNFASLAVFADFIDTCGMAPGTIINFNNYNGTADFSAAALKLNNRPLIITGSITASSGNAITLGNNNNLTFRNMTVQSGSGHVVQFTSACTNIVIRNCKLIGTSPSSGYASIYKTSSTGVLKDVYIIGNQMTNYYGIYLYLGTGSAIDAFGKNVIIDSNVISAYYYGMYSIYYGEVKIRDNQVSCMPNVGSTGFQGIYANYITGDVTGNHVTVVRNNGVSTVTSGYGMYLYYLNQYNSTGPVYVANNEIRYLGANYPQYGMYIYYTNTSSNSNRTHVVNNSIFINGTGNQYGLWVYPYYMNIKNNNVVIPNSVNTYPFYIENNAFNVSNMDFDANNFYAPTYVAGGMNGSHTSISSWQSVIPTDKNSVRVLPAFTNTDTNLKLNDYSPVFCSRYPGVDKDITGYPRLSTTAMGCYTPFISSLDLQNVAIAHSGRVVANEYVSLDVKVVSVGDAPIASATFGWSRNGIVQSTSITRNFIPALTTTGVATVNISNFTVQNQTEDIVVWIERVNGVQDNNLTNDTSRLTFKIEPLVEFVPSTIPPTPKDTIFLRNFTVCARIHTGTGAPVVNPPQLQVTTIVNGNTPILSSVPMTLVNGIWTAPFTNQLYGSKLIYLLTVSDNVGNTETVKDSVFITHIISGGDTVIAGNENNGYYYTPVIGYGPTSSYGNTYDYSWSRSLYLSNEISPLGVASGIWITNLAFQVQSGTFTFPNQKCYLRATSATVMPSGYQDPVAMGATLVYSGTWTGSTGWATVPLNSPFFLPAGMNLEVIWADSSGNKTSFTYWQTTRTFVNMVTFGYGTTWAGAMGTNSTVTYRTNARFMSYPAFNPLSGNSLSLMSVATPIDDGSMCERDYSPTRVNVVNIGENTWNFSVNNIDMGYEIASPTGVVYKGTVPLRTGILPSQGTRLVELIPQLPTLYAGNYAIKAWLMNAPDNVQLDDTVTYIYHSKRTSVPLDESFNNLVLSSEFSTVPVLGTNTWVPYQAAPSDIVKPNTPPGMLRYVGTTGSMSTFSTRQLELYGAINPRMDFWYYHDATVPDDDDTYTEVYVVADGVPHLELTLLKKNGNGWTKYTVDLKPYINARCAWIEFQSMSANRAGGTDEQFIDRILITSDIDLEVQSVAISPEITASSACALNNKTINVVIHSTINQDIDFSKYPTNLRVEIPGMAPVNYPLTSGILRGYRTMTIPVATNVRIPKGTHTLRAYLTTPIDNLAMNDTATFSLEVRPELMLTAEPISSDPDCPTNGSHVQQNVTITNTGNMDIQGITVVYRTAQGLKIQQMILATLHPNDSITVPFYYVVPGIAGYDVEINAYMTCDSALVNDRVSFHECVEINDVAVLSGTIIQPDTSVNDIMNTSNVLEVTLANISKYLDFTNVRIFAQVDGTIVTTLEDMVPKISFSDTMLFTFKEKYLVPNREGTYTVKVFIESVDNIPSNDTLSLSRIAEKKQVTGIKSIAADAFTMGQNIPNPAKNSTMIEYNVPEQGEVIFNVHSISGQLLYTQAIKSGVGKHLIELNISDFAAGVYFYSIEYKGQKLVKRMSVK